MLFAAKKSPWLLHHHDADYYSQVLNLVLQKTTKSSTEFYVTEALGDLEETIRSVVQAHCRKRKKVPGIAIKIDSAKISASSSIASKTEGIMTSKPEGVLEEEEINDEI